MYAQMNARPGRSTKAGLRAEDSLSWGWGTGIDLVWFGWGLKDSYDMTEEIQACQFG